MLQNEAARMSVDMEVLQEKQDSLLAHNTILANDKKFLQNSVESLQEKCHLTGKQKKTVENDLQLSQEETRAARDEVRRQEYNLATCCAHHLHSTAC